MYVLNKINQFIIFKNMSSSATLISSIDITANPIISIDDFRSRVIANGVALLFAYIVLQV